MKARGICHPPAVWNLILIKPLGPAAHLQKVQRPEENAGLCQENACGKIETVGTNRTNGPGSSTGKPYKETNTCNKETSETQRSHFSKSQGSFWREGGAGLEEHVESLLGCLAKF